MDSHFSDLTNGYDPNLINILYGTVATCIVDWDWIRGGSKLRGKEEKETNDSNFIFIV